MLETGSIAIKWHHFPPWSSHSREGDEWSHDTNCVSHDKCCGNRKQGEFTELWSAVLARGPGSFPKKTFHQRPESEEAS